ncbi:MarR family transcriptional regulator [Rhodobacterales bacterium HKCCE2091]|nr:MarR family transcriptional regulator [Rhodobacterales bacterium HKCCE2091]
MDGANTGAGGGMPRENSVPLEERATFLVHRINAKLALACNPAFGRFDIDLYSSRILVALRQHQRLRVGELVDLMVLPQSTISHQVKRMERKGYLKRTRSEVDNRTVEVTLTDLGREMAERCEQMSLNTYDAVLKGFSAPELEQFKSYLKRLYESIPPTIDV